MKKVALFIACFLTLATASALLPACSPCRTAMSTVSPADLGCTGSGFRISECSSTECSPVTGNLCSRVVAWKATCKKDGREFNCVSYPGERVHCSPQ
jgi:hypothetical protein